MTTVSRELVKLLGRLTDEELGALVRRSIENAPDAAPPGGIPYAPSWISDAIEAIRVQGIPVNPTSEELRALLMAKGWAGCRSLSEKKLNDALTMVINRAKAGGRDPVALLCSILKRETAKGILGGAAAVVPGRVPRDASNTTTGEGRHAWEPDVATRIKALLGHASTKRQQASKHNTPPELYRELLDEAQRYEAEAARIGPEEEAG